MDSVFCRSDIVNRTIYSFNFRGGGDYIHSIIFPFSIFYLINFHCCCRPLYNPQFSILILYIQTELLDVPYSLLNTPRMFRVIECGPWMYYDKCKPCSIMAPLLFCNGHPYTKLFFFLIAVCTQTTKQASIKRVTHSH